MLKYDLDQLHEQVQFLAELLPTTSLKKQNAEIFPIFRL